MPARELPPPVATLPAAPDPAQSSFDDLLAAHGAEIYRHLRRLSPSADDAADLHQETFLRALRGWPRLPADANRRAWLHRIAANVAIDAHRRREVRAAVAAPRPPRTDGPTSGDEVSTPDPATGPGSDPSAHAELGELRAAVRGALAELPARERSAVTARVLEGRDYSDVAAMIDCNEINARQLVSRGLRRVRVRLAPFLEIDR